MCKKFLSYDMKKKLIDKLLTYLKRTHSCDKTCEEELGHSVDSEASEKLIRWLLRQRELDGETVVKL
jgi:hypothetical protein